MIILGSRFPSKRIMLGKASIVKGAVKAHAPHSPAENGLTRARVNEAVADYLERYQEIYENAKPV